MELSTDYLDLESAKVHELFSSLEEKMGEAPWVKTAEVFIHFVKERPGMLWGSSLVPDLVPIAQPFSAIPPKEITDAEILEEYSHQLEQYPTKQEIVQWFSLIERILSEVGENPPPAIASITGKIGEIAIRNFLMRLALISPEVRMQLLPSEYLGSPPAVLKGIAKLDLNEKLQGDLNSALLHFVEIVWQEREELERILQNPTELLPIERQKLQDRLAEIERKKLRDLYEKAITDAHGTAGFRNLSGMEITVVFAPQQDLKHFRQARLIIQNGEPPNWDVSDIAER